MESSSETNERKAAGVARSASIVGLAVFSSRILGLVREQVFAAFFGASRVNDAFVVAFRIPNLFRDLLAEGALSTAFVKTFSQKTEKQGERSALELARNVLNAVALFVGLLCVVGMIFSPTLVTWMAPKFDAADHDLTARLTRLMFPFLALVALAAVTMGALNARGVFGMPAMASTFFNAGSIACGVAASFFLEPEHIGNILRALWHGEQVVRNVAAEEHAIFGMAVGVLVGGLVQFACQLPALHRTGFRWSPAMDLKDPGLHEVLKLMGPAVIGAAAVQINVFVNNNFASGLEDGGISVLNYAFRLMQFPIGVFGVAIATATLPSISRAAVSADRTEFRSTLASSLRFALFLTAPSAVGLAVLGEPIIALIYQRGAFGAADTALTAEALAAYSLGLVGYSLIKILAPAFYAIDDARTPARISLLSILINLGLNAALVGPLRHTGLALSTALVATLNAVLLFELLRRRVGSLRGSYLLDGIVRVAIASAVLGGVCHFARLGIELVIEPRSTGTRAIIAFGAIAAGSIAYFAMAMLLRIEEITRVRGLLQRKARARSG